jgi:hypothetical protein
MRSALGLLSTNRRRWAGGDPACAQILKQFERRRNDHVALVEANAIDVHHQDFEIVEASFTLRFELTVAAESAVGFIALAGRRRVGLEATLKRRRRLLEQGAGSWANESSSKKTSTFRCATDAC